MEGPSGPRGQKGESGSVGEGYQFLSRDEVTARCDDDDCFDEVEVEGIGGYQSLFSKLFSGTFNLFVSVSE